THRLASLAAACKRLGVHSIDAIALDASHTLPFASDGAQFDRVLIDAPCSGTGTLRRNPEIKWRLTPDDMPRLAEVQLSLLARAAELTRSGGRLVYSTCSVEREENEEVIARFLEAGAPVRVIESNAPAAVITPDRFVRTFPHRNLSDGFFAATIEKV
ncbi:MAG TPA: RsmB/NOP family class I SAM-dependent RNA methyltransferase, partial [Blastocatellia bacterium]|nr:RsmB/NOP family class I SAM-dependent RNA methyltransferase [Blastocatellia bacterium]